MRNSFNYFAAKSRSGQAGFRGKATRAERKSLFQEKQRSFSKDPIFTRNQTSFTPEKGDFKINYKTTPTPKGKTTKASESGFSKAKIEAALGTNQPDNVGTSRSNFFKLNKREKEELWKSYNEGVYAPYEGDFYREEGELNFI